MLSVIIIFKDETIDTNLEEGNLQPLKCSSAFKKKNNSFSIWKNKTLKKSYLAIIKKKTTRHKYNRTQ